MVQREKVVVVLLLVTIVLSILSAILTLTISAPAAQAAGDNTVEVTPEDIEALTEDFDTSEGSDVIFTLEEAS